MPDNQTTDPWSRDFIGDQPFKHQVWCCGRTDEAGLLSEIVGWAVGCQSQEEKEVEVADLQRRGYLRKRAHVAPMGTWEAWALTAAGFDRLAQIGYGDMHDSAVRRHRWYAERGSMGGTSDAQ